MPKQVKIKTNKGVVYVGLVNPKSQYSTVGNLLVGYTDLGKFAGLPNEPRHMWENDITSTTHLPQDSTSLVATLKNGNKLIITSYATRDGGDTYLAYEMYFTAHPENSRTFNRPMYSPRHGVRYNVGISELFPPYDGDRPWAPFTYPDSDKDVVIGEPINFDYCNYSDINLLADFVTGSLVPNFPGEDNENDPEGGDGEGPDGVEDDPIEAPEDPSISAVASGLLTLYTPTLSQIHAFGNFLWSDLFSLDTFKKLFSDPMQAVIGLSALPIHVPSTTISNIIIGSVDSGVRASVAAKQFVRKDCGTIHINPTWNTALDYEPYTKFSIFLPYIGTRELKTDDIMNKDINVSYLIDILSGSCTAHIKVGGSVLYQFSGSCAVPIPVTGTSWNNLLTSCIQLAGAGIVTAASGGAASAAVAGAMAASSTANMVANAKPNIQRTGAVSGAAGMLGVQTPYLIRETPRQSLAKGYNKFVGYPSNITSKLGDLKGYTQVENIHLENLSCTADEAAEIESLLKEGVII